LKNGIRRPGNGNEQPHGSPHYFTERSIQKQTKQTAGYS
jgi:hypothetical protein